jgi:hypothetical protein
MSKHAVDFRREYEVCREQAAKTDVAASRAQWLVFADEWLKLALAAEALGETRGCRAGRRKVKWIKVKNRPHPAFSRMMDRV